MKTIVSLVGLPGSGKTAAADIFRSQGYVVLRFGDQTDIALSELGLPRTEENERTYRERIRKELGMAAMAIKIEPRIRAAESESDTIVLDGMRSWEEYEYLKRIIPNLIVLAIYASPRVRYGRLKTRPVRPLTEAESVARDKAEIENLHSGGPIAIADYVISNEGSPEDFTKNLLDFIHSVS